LPKLRLSPNANLGRPPPDACSVYLSTCNLGRSREKASVTRKSNHSKAVTQMTELLGLRTGYVPISGTKLNVSCRAMEA
jgi:hypothetical protein